MTSNLGSGHSRTSEGIEHALLEQDPAARIRQFDFWNLMDESVARVMKEAYLELVTHYPDLYDNLYGHDRHSLVQLLVAGGIPDQVMAVVQGLRSRQVMGAARWLSPHHSLLDRALFTFFLASLASPHHFRAGRIFRRRVLKWIPLQLARRLWAEVLRFSPDAIVATQMHPAALLSGFGRWRSMGASVVVAVLTHYGVHDLWAQGRTDHYCVPTEDAARDLRTQGVQAHRIHLTGIPLMPGFRRLPSCTQARQELGLDPVRPTLLVAVADWDSAFIGW